MDTSVEEKKSRIYIEFKEPNSTLFDSKVENITALQLLVLAGYLENKARFMLTQQEIYNAEQEAMRHVSVPPNKIEIGHR
jgi:hypothetical protein